MLIPQSEDSRITAFFEIVWPKRLLEATSFGKRRRQPADMEDGLDSAYDAVIFAIWPANTHLRFVKLRGFDNGIQPDFHKRRQALAEGKTLKYIHIESCDLIG